MGRAVRQGGSFHSLRNTGHTGKRLIMERIKHFEIEDGRIPKGQRRRIKPAIFNAAQMEGWGRVLVREGRLDCSGGNRKFANTSVGRKWKCPPASSRGKVGSGIRFGMRRQKQLLQGAFRAWVGWT